MLGFASLNPTYLHIAKESILNAGARPQGEPLNAIFLCFGHSGQK